MNVPFSEHPVQGFLYLCEVNTLGGVCYFFWYGLCFFQVAFTLVISSLNPFEMILSNSGDPWLSVYILEQDGKTPVGSCVPGVYSLEGELVGTFLWGNPEVSIFRSFRLG